MQPPANRKKRSDSPPDHGEKRDGEWFYTRGHQTFGPVSTADLIATIRLGFLHPDDYVCRVGRRGWIKISTISLYSKPQELP